MHPSLQTGHVGNKLRLLFALILVLGGWLPGVIAESAPDLHDRLAATVGYLCKPELNGRKAGSWGSRLARAYIEKQFRASGLSPWSGAKKYQLGFRVGKNIVGVLPGSDPALAREIVLFSAHYDHLGADPQGHVLPGAADNASGVAVLLEAARLFGASNPRPKRTLVFAAFDAEENMLLGSFAFCCRPDVEQARIVAAVNVDMLGRDFMDVVTNTVFVAGTESLPEFRRPIAALAQAAGIRLLPLGSDIIGPRSDHAAFETRSNTGCLFFSCGTFGDYHQPGDTPEKLNWPGLERSACLILSTLQLLADAPSLQPAIAPDAPDREELANISLVLSEIVQNSGKARIQPNDRGRFAELDKHVKEILQHEPYTRDMREHLLMDAGAVVGAYTLGPGTAGASTNATWNALLPLLAHLYVRYHHEMLEGQKRLVSELLEHPPGLFRGFPNFEYEFYDIPDDNISISPIEGGRFAFHALGTSSVWRSGCKYRFWPLRSSSLVISASCEALDCEGTRDEIRSACLLRLRRSRTNLVHVTATRKLLQALDGVEPTGGYKEWMAQTLQRQGFHSETDWLLNCLNSSNPALLMEAISASAGLKEPAIWRRFNEIIADPRGRADIRARAIWAASAYRNKATLNTLVDVLDDPSTVDDRAFVPQFKSGYPLGGTTSLRALRGLLELQYSRAADPLGTTALHYLKQLTKKDFGKDQDRWRQWLRHHDV